MSARTQVGVPSRTYVPGVPIPAGSSDLTASWLSRALAGSDILGDAIVSSVDVEPVAGGGGFVGEIFRCTLTTTPPRTRRLTVIAKLPCTDGARRALLDRFAVHEREVRFYAELGDSSGVAVPRCYIAARDAVSGDSVLLLEDVAPFCTADLVAGCGIAQAKSSIDTAARMHGRWWAQERLAAFEWLPPLANAVILDLASTTYERAWDAFLVAFGAHMPREVRRVGERMGEVLPIVLDRLSRPPLTLIHGDFQAANIFFDADDRVTTVIDWPGLMRARGPIDLAWFLSSSLDSQLRRRNEARLIRHYHAALAAEGVVGYSLRECLEDYRLGLLLRFGFAVLMTHALAPGVADSPNPRRDSVAAVAGARLIAALLDTRPEEAVEPRRWWGGLPLRRWPRRDHKG